MAPRRARRLPAVGSIRSRSSSVLHAPAPGYRGHPAGERFTLARRTARAPAIGNGATHEPRPPASAHQCSRLGRPRPSSQATQSGPGRRRHHRRHRRDCAYLELGGPYPPAASPCAGTPLSAAPWDHRCCWERCTAHARDRRSPPTGERSPIVANWVWELGSPIREARRQGRHILAPRANCRPPHGAAGERSSLPGEIRAWSASEAAAKSATGGSIERPAGTRLAGERPAISISAATASSWRGSPQRRLGSALS